MAKFWDWKKKTDEPAEEPVEPASGVAEGGPEAAAALEPGSEGVESASGVADDTPVADDVAASDEAPVADEAVQPVMIEPLTPEQEPAAEIEPATPHEDPSLTGSIEALGPVEPALTPDATGPQADAVSDLQGMAATTVMPSTPGMTDEEAAARAAASLPAAPAPQPAAELQAPTTVEPAPSELIDMGPERPSRWWLWVLIGLLIIAIAGGVGYWYWWSTSRPVAVPDVVGKQSGEATQIFNDVGLRLGEVSEVPTDSAPIGTILSQNPEAGTRLQPGDRVSFTVALPSTQTKVPDTNGRTSADAQVELAKARLRPVVVESFAATVAAGYVVTQLPTAGLELPPGSSVALVVSKGPVPASSSVPNVTRLAEADSTTLMQARNLKPLMYRGYDASFTAGTAITQIPQPGTAAPYNSYAMVLISQGAGTPTVSVPNVVGQSKSSATKELKAAKFAVDTHNIPHPTVPKGQVVYQIPPATRKAVSGSIVGLLISRGNTAAATVPSLIGTPSVSVADAVKRVGFTSVAVEVPMGAFPPGTVFAQYPEGGTQLTKGLPIVVLVAAVPPAASTPLGATVAPGSAGAPAGLGTPAVPGSTAATPFPPRP